MQKWYLAAQNDGLFIIDTPPRPSNDYPNHNYGPKMVIPIPLESRELVELIIAHHNHNE